MALLGLESYRFFKEKKISSVRAGVRCILCVWGWGVMRAVDVGEVWSC